MNNKTLKSLKLNVILNSIKQCCSILFPLITFPYISRVLGKSGFGKYSFSLSIITYFILIASLGINTYAVREGAKIRDNKLKINNLSCELFSINIVFTFLSYILLIALLFFNRTIFSYSKYIVILSSAILLSCLGAEWVNNIYEDFLYITCRYIVIQLISLILIFLFVKNKSDVAIYCVIATFATYGGNLVNILYIRKYVKLKFVFKMNFKKHIKPLLILFINQLAITIYVNIDTTMIGFYYNSAQVGLYSFASKIYTILKQLINAVVMVMIPRLAYIVNKNNDKFKYYLETLISVVTGLILPITIGMIMLAKQILIVIGGSGYIAAKSTLQILSIAILFAVYASILSYGVLIVYKKEKESLFSAIITAFLNVVLNFYFIPRFGIMGAAVTTTIAELANFIILLFFVKRIIIISCPLKDFFQYLLGCIVIFIICLFSRIFIYNLILQLIVSISVSAIMYFLVLVLCKNRFALQVIKYLKKF